MSNAGTTPHSTSNWKTTGIVYGVDAAADSVVNFGEAMVEQLFTIWLSVNAHRSGLARL
jgi:hypothetical protein